MKHLLAFICAWEILGIYTRQVPTISRTLHLVRDTGWAGRIAVAALTAAAIGWIVVHINVERLSSL